ncbi:HAD family hydrolase [Novipirellula artificiosorum]|uniref:Haloacid dehalogenase-like hydrolase n=1 Tax=Novipirellula artificiosorum TaxID=2528016 RepID=A0A5C6D342_9BACT|nr:HAD family hydrolase [Novipirellula artificiosorum]TWU31603.1 haloacid dehalogenase-like hydrolase [Novipirellula artificiosorum]
MKMIQQAMMGIALTLMLTVSAMAQEQALASSDSSTQHADPLGSWNDGPTKSSILQFVQEVTKEGGPKFVPPEQRIATFDNDGTLWCEQPVVQFEFAVYRIKAMAGDHPEWKEQEPYKSVLAGDPQHLVDDLINGGHEFLKVMETSHAGMSVEEFDRHVRDFFATAKHPKLNVAYTQLAYTPMVELLAYLRANGFKTYICSGGGIDFMRAISEETYGIVPENVIGTNGRNVFKQVDGKWQLFKTADHLFFNDKATKPTGIDLHIGRKPIFAGGNVRSGGDIGMLTYCHSNTLPSFQLLVNHDDDEREYAYAEKDNASLKTAKAQGWHVLNMKSDWKTIFSND